MYKKATRSKLLEMWGKADDLESKAQVLDRKASTIKSNVQSTISEKFKKSTEKDFHKIGEAQINEMIKQWKLLSASTVRVKRTIKLPGFHNNLNLCINPRYGVKKLKCYSGWTPFHIYDLKSMANRGEAPYEIAGSILRVGDETLDFAQLDNIPQLDPERVEMLAGLTYDIVKTIDSWIDFFGSSNKRTMEDYDLILRITDRYHHPSGDEWPTIIKRLPELENVRDTIQGKLEAQANKWKPTLQKWQARNKNFVVLSELAKTDLRI